MTARTGAPFRNTLDTIRPGCAAGLLLHVESDGKRKSSSPGPEKRIPTCSQEHRFPPPSADSRDKGDFACTETVRPPRARRNVARCREQLRSASKPRPMFATRHSETRVTRQSLSLPARMYE